MVQAHLLLGLGMVIYSEIVSPGYFAQLNQWAFVLMFAVLFFGAVWSVMRPLSRDEVRMRSRSKGDLHSGIRPHYAGC